MRSTTDRDQLAALVVDGLAAFRLTRLVVDDTITDKARSLTLTTAERIGGSSASDFAADLLSCYWCAGMWVSAGVVCARTCAPRMWRPVAATLALSAIAGLLGSLRYDSGS